MSLKDAPNPIVRVQAFVDIPARDSLALEFMKCMLQGGELSEFSDLVAKAMSDMIGAGISPADQAELAETIDTQVADSFVGQAYCLAEAYLKKIDERLEESLGVKNE